MGCGTCGGAAFRASGTLLHTEGVVGRARRVSEAMAEEEGEMLVAAAYLHDIGYAPTLARTGFHPLDGALHLRELGEERLAGLVAYHSGAEVEARLRGLADHLARFDRESSDVCGRSYVLRRDDGSGWFGRRP
jgi:HD superfamily phosphodiesterase